MEIPELIERAVQIELNRRSLWEFCKTISPSFYNEYRPHLKILCDSFQALYERRVGRNELGEWMIFDNPQEFYCKKMMWNIPPQHGKMLPSNTPILTSKGWKNHSDLKIGDYVFGQDGKQKKVLFVHPIHEWEGFQINFQDGKNIVASKDHLWKLMIELDDHKGRREMIIETKDIFKLKNRRSPSIICSPALDLKETDLPINPYILGVWLGDGDKRGGIITCGEEDIEYFKKLGSVTKEKNRSVYRININGLTKLLRLNGLQRNKHIPINYLLSSIKQRTELLQGLMDTDGCTDERGNCEFTQMEGELAKDVYTLLRSLGYKARINHYDATLNGKKVGVKTRINFNPNKNDIIFSLPRKVKRLQNKTTKDRDDKNKLFISSIESVGIVTGNCISVEGGMYLAGYDLIPTHNTRTLINGITWVLGKNINEKVIVASYNDGIASDFSKYTRDAITISKNDPMDINYSDIFPKTKIKKGSGGFEKWALEGNHFSYLGAGIGGSITSKGGTFLVVDDPIKNAEDAWNERNLERIWNFYTGTLSSRRTVDENVIIDENTIAESPFEILNMTRWSNRDLCGRILDSKEAADWFIIKMKAYDEVNDKMLCQSLLSKEDYLNLKDRQPPSIFDANYFQDPVENKGTLFPLKELKRFSRKELEELRKNQEKGTQYRVGYWDIADEGDDNLCGGIGDIFGKFVYIDEIIFNQYNTDITIPQSVALLKRLLPKYARVETNGQGSIYIKYLRERLKSEGVETTLLPINNSTHKNTRIIMQEMFVKNHFKFLCDDDIILGSEYYNFMQQLSRYLKDGTYKKDDAPDFVSGLAQMIDGFYPDIFK